MTNIIDIYFDSVGSTATAPSKLWQWSKGQVVRINGLDLPTVYQVHFSNNPTLGTAEPVAVSGNMVSIPDIYLTTGEPVYLFIWLSDETSAETIRKGTIYVAKRSQPSGAYDPTAEQQTIIDGLIGSINTAVDTAEGYAESAQTYSGNAATSATEALNAKDAAQGYAEQASQTAQGVEILVNRAEDAADDAETAKQDVEQLKQAVEGLADDAESAKTDAETARGEASASATTASTKASEALQSASQASQSANTATEQAQTATAKATEASQSAETATAKATEASASATTASTKASEASTSASTATTAKNDAVTAKNAAVTAKTGAETARNGAEAAAQSIEQSAQQIAANTSDIADLKEDLTQPYSVLGQQYEIGVGYWANGNFTPWVKRLANKTKIPVSKNDIVEYTSPTLEIYLLMYTDENATTASHETGWIPPSDAKKVYVCPENGWVCIQFRGVNNETLTVNDYNATVNIYNTTKGRIDSLARQSSSDHEEISLLSSSINTLNDSIGIDKYQLAWEQGTISSAGGLADDTKRIRTSEFYEMPSYLRISVPEQCKYTVKQFYANGNIANDSNWKTDDEVVEKVNGSTKFKLTLAYVNDAVINPSEGDSVFALRVYNNIGEQVDELYNNVFGERNYTYYGEKFQSKVNGFNAQKVVKLSYDSGQTLNDITIYDKYLVCGINPGRIQIYDLSNSTKIMDAYVFKGSVQQTEHFASLTVSNTFYDSDDLLPLLYAEVETGGLYDVIRIKNVSDGIEVVKQYKFDTETSGINPIIAFDFSQGIGYGVNRFGDLFKLVKYNLEQETENEDGTFTFAVISTGDCPNVRVRQGIAYYNRRVYMLSTRATSAPFETKILGLNCDTENAVIVSEAQNLPFTGEGEGLAISIENNVAYMYITDYYNVYKLSF